MTIGQRGEVGVYELLRGYSIQVVRCYPSCPFDLIVNGRRVEVKTSVAPRSRTWNFNIHRRGKLDESRVDAYIFRLEGVPGRVKPLHVIVPAPVNKSTVAISLRSLKRQWAKHCGSLAPLGFPNRYIMGDKQEREL